MQACSVGINPKPASSEAVVIYLPSCLSVCCCKLLLPLPLLSLVYCGQPIKRTDIGTQDKQTVETGRQTDRQTYRRRENDKGQMENVTKFELTTLNYA